MTNHKFLICTICGNMVGLIHDAGAPLSCCGQAMQELTANTVEASAEKHIPVVTIEGDVVTVQVGSVIHPMIEEHHIRFIYLNTKQGGQRKRLEVGSEPIATFHLAGDTLHEVYEYCNIHGLWKASIPT